MTETVLDLPAILAGHKKWANGEKGGKRAYLGGAFLGGADLRGADLRGADLRGAFLGGADLRGAYLGGAFLGGADLGGADLRGAYLGGAYLRGAYLGGADLRGAYLGDEKLKIERVLTRVLRSDDYEFTAFRMEDKSVLVIAGCRGPWTVERYRKHVADSYPATDKATETLSILDFIDLRDKATAEKQEAA